MPLSALDLYIQSKYKYEIQHDVYLFGTLQALLRKTPYANFSDYPSWLDFISNKPKEAKKQTQTQAKYMTKEEAIDFIFEEI